MDNDMAVRLAATAVEGVSVSQAREIIKEYVSALSTCAVCNGSGRFVVMTHATLDGTDRGGRTVATGRFEPGTTFGCLRCGNGNPGKDPAYVGWQCTQGSTIEKCQNSQEGDDNAKWPHAACGYRIILPLDLLNPSGEP